MLETETQTRWGGRKTISGCARTGWRAWSAVGGSEVLADGARVVDGEAGERKAGEPRYKW